MTASGPSPLGGNASEHAAGAPASAAEYWNSLLRSEVELQPPYCANLATQMRKRKLTFGDRIHCPFLRPFFLDERDEARVRAVAETIAGLGERVVQAALASKELLESARSAA